MAANDLHLRFDEIPVDENEPFKYCALGREKYATILTSVIKAYGRTGGVVALNGEWGAGKTTFVRMWRQSLNNLGYKTLYFNAWESDYSVDPLMAMIAELSDAFPNDTRLKDVVQKGAKIVLPLAAEVAKGLAHKISGIDVKAVGSIIDAVKTIGEDYLKEYKSNKETFESFKKSFGEFVDKNTEILPLVFFIDELDRCNPEYAVKVLERVKHLFDVKKVVFVLSVNLKQLGYAVKGYYKSDRMDSDEYLRRFIDIVYSLPEPDMFSFSKYLYEKYQIKEYFESSVRSEYYELKSEGETFLMMSSEMAKYNHLNLRLMEKIFAFSRIILAEFGPRSYTMSGTLFLLVYWNLVDNDFYQNIKHGSYSIQSLIDNIERRMPYELLSDAGAKYSHSNNTFIYSLGGLIHSYNILDYGQESDLNLIVYDTQNNVLSSPITTNIINKESLVQAIDYYKKHYTMDRISIKYLCEKIDLLDDLSM